MMQLIIHFQEITFCCRLQIFKIISSTPPAVAIKNEVARAKKVLKNDFINFSKTTFKSIYMHRE